MENQVPTDEENPVATAPPIPPPTQQPPPPQKTGGLKSKLPLILIALVILSLVVLGGYFVLNQTKNSEPTPTPTPEPVACTQEAKLCPDGVTYVGRTGPDCEFEACPATDSAQTPDSLSPTTPDSTPPGELE